MGLLKHQMAAIMATIPVNTAFTVMGLPGIKGWWDASDVSTISTSGASVTEWRDKSGYVAGNKMSQLTAARQMTTGTRNGLNCIVGDGAQLRGMTLATPIQLDATFWAFAFCKMATNNALINQWANTDPFSGNRYMMQVRTDGIWCNLNPNSYFNGSARTNTGNYSNTAIALSLNSYTAAQAPAGAPYYGSAGLAGYVNTSLGVANGTERFGMIVTDICYNRQFPTDPAFNGQVYEIFFGDGHLTDVQILAALNYGIAKWAI